MGEIKKNTIVEAFKTIYAKSNNKHIIHKMYLNIIYESDKALYDKLKEQYPKLLSMRWDFEIVLLMCLGFDNDEIAFFLCLEKNTVEHKQSDIRRDFGIEKRSNIVSFFLDKVKEK